MGSAGIGAPEGSGAAALDRVRALVRAGVRHLEAGAHAEAAEALAAAAAILVDVHADLDRTAPAPEGLGDALRWICFRLNDARLLNDPGAARAAERALAPLASAATSGEDP